MSPGYGDHCARTHFDIQKIGNTSSRAVSAADVAGGVASSL